MPSTCSAEHRRARISALITESRTVVRSISLTPGARLARTGVGRRAPVASRTRRWASSEAAWASSCSHSTTMVGGSIRRARRPTGRWRSATILGRPGGRDEAPVQPGRRLGRDQPEQWDIVWLGRSAPGCGASCGATPSKMARHDARTTAPIAPEGQQQKPFHLPEATCVAIARGARAWRFSDGPARTRGVADRST